MDERDDLPFGLYERLITEQLKTKLLTFDPVRVKVVKAAVDEAEVPGVLARHIQTAVARALGGLPKAQRLETQTRLVNELLALVSSDEFKGDAEGDLVPQPPEQLRALQRLTGSTPTPDPIQPLVGLSDSDLLVNARGEPGLAKAIAHELPSADSVDLLCAFVRWHGVRLLEAQIAAHCAAGRRLRVITTVYTGSTERKALDWLVAQGAEVKVSYDIQSTRLHAKAWLFRRKTGYSTAYIGSSNLSKSAMVDGVEWNVRLSQVGSPDILDKFGATFDTYWESPEYETYQPARDAARFDRAVAPADAGQNEDQPLFLDVAPWPHQREMLDRLAVERERHHRYRNLVVAATGTGKTILAALDYQRLCAQRGVRLRLLFVAHRQEILRQSLSAFRQVLRDGAFGELYVDGHRPDEWQHVFASVQSLANADLANLRPEAFDMVIVDEFHHSGARTYQTLLQRLFPADEGPAPAVAPRILLGLTATPERTDGEDILHFFGGHIAVEMRLWDAMERGLLTPFQYFGLSDNTDLSAVTWSRQKYDVAALEHLYTADDARVRLVLEQLQQKHRDLNQMKALGFCVSIGHARFMAARCTDRGVPALAVTAESTSDERREAIAALQAGRVRVLFAVDLFNEGVDIPEVDTLLFLRPTESALVFLQQLGRGLRRHERKDCVTVLDFIGKAHRKFRFDLRYRAITGATRTEVARQIEGGFPFLPAGCSIQLDRVATETVLDNLRTAIPALRPSMVAELKALAYARDRTKPVRLGWFLEESGLELEDVYRGGAWSDLKRAAGLDVPLAGPDEEALGNRLGSLLYLDDAQRLTTYARVAEANAVDQFGPAEQRILTGLHFALVPKQVGITTLADSLAFLRRHPAVLEELAELSPLLEERTTHLPAPLGLTDGSGRGVPLSVHARYSMRDVLTAFGLLDFGLAAWEQTGVFRDEATNTDFFFVTLEKSEREYSPSTLYKDYAISSTLFHWQSQSTTTQQSSVGQRYIHHGARNGHIVLFVRPRKKAGGLTVPYTCLGEADYVSHTGERPINFVWRLRTPMPADIFRLAKVASG